MKLIRLAGAEIELHDSGLTITRYGSRQVDALPHDSGEYRQRAFDLGYGTDTARMSREHEVGHSLLAHLLGLPASPTLIEVAHGRTWRHWRQEEAAVLALQGYARVAKVDLEAVAIKLSKD